MYSLSKIKTNKRKQFFGKYAYKYVRAQNMIFKRLLVPAKVKYLNYSKLKQSHRFANYYWLKKIFFNQ